MKSKRHAKILDLIAGSIIDTQESLLENLRDCGFNMTQATISRDIRELGIHKVRTDDGKYRYVSMRMKQSASIAEKFSMIFFESAKSVDHAQNIVVVKCHPGMANAACAMFDTAQFDEVVGTLSGDDTFLIVSRTIETAEKISEHLQKLINK